MARRAAPGASILYLASLLALDCAAADGSVTVPLKLAGHFPLVAVSIDGVNVPLVFDSGNSGSISLAQSVLDRSHAQPTAVTSRGMDAKGNVIEYPKFKIPRIEIGTLAFTDVVGELDVHDPSYQATPVGQQGFLGTALLKAYKVVLDYPHRRMTLVPADAANDPEDACRGTIVPFSPAWHGEPVTEADIDLGHLTVWWDTGTPALVLSKKFAGERHSSVSKGDLDMTRLIFGGVDFGPARFQIWDVTLPPGFEGFIGYPFLAQHIVCMDFPGKRLRIQH